VIEHLRPKRHGNKQLPRAAQETASIISSLTSQKWLVILTTPISTRSPIGDVKIPLGNTRLIVLRSRRPIDETLPEYLW